MKALEQNFRVLLFNTKFEILFLFFSLSYFLVLLGIKQEVPSKGANVFSIFFF